MYYIDYVEYAGQRYKCRVIDTVYGDTLIGPLELEEKLLNEQVQKTDYIHPPKTVISVHF